MCEKIEHDGKIIALIVRDLFNKEGVNFFTSNDNSLQLGILIHKKEHIIKSHIHKRSIKKIDDVQEVLYVSYGKIEAIFYNNLGEEVIKKILKKGDTLLLISGGHGFRILEDSKIIEIKQGPYKGIDDDKKRW